MDLARADSPRGEVVLREVRRDGRTVVELRVNGVFVMDDVETSSERALATESLARCDAPRRVLVGGLGLGFTLAEVLADDRVEHVVVAEIEESVVAWMRDGTVPHGAVLLGDPRVEVLVADVVDVVRQAGDAAYDLVLLDVDNGPASLVHAGNARLYDPERLTDLWRLLDEGGLLVVWSMTHEAGLLRALGEVFGTAGSVQAVAYDVTLGSGPHARAERYWLHLAERAVPPAERAVPPAERAVSSES